MATLAEHINENYSSPSDGDAFDWGGVRYTYNGAAQIWHSTLPDLADLPGDAAVQATAPDNPVEGEVWYNGDRLMINVGGVWVDASPQLDPSTLQIASNLQVSGSGVTAPAINTINVSHSIDTGTGNVQVSPGDTGTVNIDVRFPNVPEAPSFPAPAMSGGETVSADYVASVASDGTMSYVDLDTAISNSPTFGDVVSSAVETLDLDTFADVSTATPAAGQILTWDDTNSRWAPMNAPTVSNNVSYNDSTDVLTINSDTHQIPYVSNLSLSGSSLTIVQTGADDVSIDLGGLGGGTATPDNTITVNTSTNISTVIFPSDAVSVTGSVATITLPEIPDIPEIDPLVVKSNGVSASPDVSTIDFTGGGVTVNNIGNGRVRVDIPEATGGGSSAVPSMTAVANIDTVSSFLGWNDVSDRSQFTLTGGPGGTKHKVIIKNDTNSSIQLKYLTTTEHCKSVTMLGARSWGLWDPDAPTIRYFTEGTTSSSLVWGNDTNRPIASREVVYMEIHLIEDGKFQFISNSSSLQFYNAAEVQDTEAAVLEDVPESAMPQPDPEPSMSEGTVSDNHVGLFAPTGDASFEDASGEGTLPWGNLSFSDYVKSLFSEQMGGNGSDSPRSTNGNDYWGTDSNRARSGIWQESWGTTISGSHPQNHGISVVLPQVDPDDPVMARINQYANDPDLWHSHLITFLRDDSALERGSTGFVNSPNATLQVVDNGANIGQRQAIRSLSGPGNGPFSDQYSFASAAGTYFAGYDYEYMYNIPGNTPLSETLRHQYNRVAFNIPNDPDNATVEIRRRGKLIENDPLLSGTLDGAAGYFVGTNPGFSGVHSPIDNYLGETKLTNDRERRVIMDFPLEQFTGGNVTERRENAVRWGRAVVGTSVTATGLANFEATIKRKTSGPGYTIASGQEAQVDSSGNWVRMCFMMDENGDILSGLTALSPTEQTARGLPALPTGSQVADTNAYGPLLFRREVPIATIIDTRGGVSTRDEDYQLAQARLWQIEYRLIL